MRDNQFTPGARGALRQAREAAGQLGHGYIGSEHLLLGILQEGGCARGCLQEQAVTPEKIRSVLGEPPPTSSPRPPHTGPSQSSAGLPEYLSSSIPGI